MINSDPPLTPPDEKLMACVDGRLPPEERAAFERDHPAAVAESAALARLGDALRKHSPAPALQNAGFFNHQILREITPGEQPATAGVPTWKLWRLAFAGACSALASVGIYKAAVAPDTLQTKYFAEVLSVKAGDRLLTAQVVSKDGITVVWVDGFDKLPRDYVFK